MDQPGIRHAGAGDQRPRSAAPRRRRGRRPAWSTSRSTCAGSRCPPGSPTRSRPSLTDLAALPGRRRRRPPRSPPGTAARPTRCCSPPGAAQAFVLLAQALRGARRPVVVHPQFTEPEAALRTAGHAVERVLLRRGGRLPARPGRWCRTTPTWSFVGNPTNPTSVLHPAADDRRAGPARPGAGGRRGVRRHHVRRATASRSRWPAGATCPAWSCCAASPRPGGWPGCGSATCSAAPDLVRPAGRRAAAVGRSRRPRSPRPTACASPAAVAAERADRRARSAADRDHLVRAPARRAGRHGAPATRPARSSLVRLAGADKVRLALRERGYAVRRGDTFPGLGADWLRIAVRDTATTDAFVGRVDRRDQGAAVTLETTLAAIRPARRGGDGRRPGAAGPADQAGRARWARWRSCRCGWPGWPGPARRRCPSRPRWRSSPATTACTPRASRPWPQEVTAQMVANFLAGGAVVNAFARQVGADVIVVDVGVASAAATPAPRPGRRARSGAGTRGPDRRAGDDPRRGARRRSRSASRSPATWSTAARGACSPATWASPTRPRPPR